MKKYDFELKQLLGKCPVLTREEEFDAWKRGDEELLIRSQLPWAMRIASNLCKKLKFSDRDIVFSAANMGLVKSVKTFDGTKGFRLTTYVYRMVCWEVYREVEKATNEGKTLEYRRRNPFKVRPLSDNCENLAGEFDLFEEVVRADEYKELHEAISQLPEIYAIVIIRRMEGAALKDIAAECGVTKQAIQQRWPNAMRALKALLQGKIAA